MYICKPFHLSIPSVNTSCRMCWMRVNSPMMVAAPFRSLLCVLSWGNLRWPEVIWRQTWLGIPMRMLSALRSLHAPSHYPNLCWLIIKCVLWHSLQHNFTKGANKLNWSHVFKDYSFKITATSLRGHRVKDMIIQSHENPDCIATSLAPVISCSNFISVFFELSSLIRSGDSVQG